MASENTILRVLIILVFAQAMLVTLVGARVMAIDSRTDRIEEQLFSAIQRPGATNAAAPNSQSVTANADTTRFSSGLTPDDIRSIIREELAEASAQNTTDQKAPQRSIENSLSVSETADRTLEFDRTINRYIALGAISPGQMADLQNQIARLPPTQRSAALSRLSKAMNEGLLEGQL